MFCLEMITIISKFITKYAIRTTSTCILVLDFAMETLIKTYSKPIPTIFKSLCPGTTSKHMPIITHKAYSHSGPISHISPWSNRLSSRCWRSRTPPAVWWGRGQSFLTRPEWSKEFLCCIKTQWWKGEGLGHLKQLVRQAVGCCQGGGVG